jgi:hypothetical protein
MRFFRCRRCGHVEDGRRVGDFLEPTLDDAQFAFTPNEQVLAKLGQPLT